MDKNTPRENESVAELADFSTPISANEVDPEGVLDFLASGENKIETLPVQHFFADGQYVRVSHMPKDSIIVGKKHKGSTLNILLTGHITVYTVENTEPLNIVAPHIFQSEANVRKVVIARTDASFANIHVTDTKDLEELEKELIIPETDEMMQSDLRSIFGKRGRE